MVFYIYRFNSERSVSDRSILFPNLFLNQIATNQCRINLDDTFSFYLFHNIRSAESLKHQTMMNSKQIRLQFFKISENNSIHMILCNPKITKTRFSV